MTKAVCTGPECVRDAVAHGLCMGHYGQRRRGRPITALRGMSSRTARDEQGRKFCPRCARWRSEESFTTMRQTSDGLAGLCRECAAMEALMRRYNLDAERYASMLEAQGVRCAVCGATEPGQRTWHVDHDHSCCPGGNSCGTCVRALLCARCNMALGGVKESVETMRRMIGYLTGAPQDHGFTAGTLAVSALREIASAGRTPHYIRQYGITVEQYLELFVLQGGRCATCHTQEAGQIRWSIDHDHSCCPKRRSCGRCVRGLLCSPCNFALGHFLDDPATIAAAVGYLAAPRQEPVPV
ncbi:recombination endonuclease VII [Kocuria dechangensis]|uniref:Recombination endonuclease VII n=1 Tax=Kocuria dechangensis TaxID=1176249 RepID=A0A917M033_9MICC|nr:endonuclease domain-containing protein [Kocuria dechangensis]GGG68638.1 recombination endonuclease VII [Kocuria dechangensis]